MSTSKSPRDIADLLRKEKGPEGAETHLQRVVATATGERQSRALAALGELRKFKSEAESVSADACSALGCRATDRLQRIDGRVLCEYCAIEYRQS